MTTFRDVQASMIKFSEQLTLAQAQLNGMQAVIAATVNPVAQVMSNTINALIIHLNNKKTRRSMYYRRYYKRSYPSRRNQQ